MSVSADRPPLYSVIPLSTGKSFLGGNFQQLLRVRARIRNPEIFIQFDVSLMYPNICPGRCCPGIFEFRTLPVYRIVTFCLIIERGGRIL